MHWSKDMRHFKQLLNRDISVPGHKTCISLPQDFLLKHDSLNEKHNPHPRGGEGWRLVDCVEIQIYNTKQKNPWNYDAPGQEGKWTPIYVGRLLYLCVRRFNKQFQENCSFHEFHRSGFPGFTAQKRPSSSLTTAVHRTCRFDSSLQSRRCQRSSALIFIVQFNSLSVVCTNNPVWRSKHNTSWWKRSRPVSLSKAVEILNHPVSHQRSYTLHGVHRSSVELCGSQCLSIEEVAHSFSGLPFISLHVISFLSCSCLSSPFPSSRRSSVICSFRISDPNFFLSSICSLK